MRLRASWGAELTRTMEKRMGVAIGPEVRSRDSAEVQPGGFGDKQDSLPGLGFPVCMAERPEVSLGLGWGGMRQGVGGRVPGKCDFQGPCL